MKATFSDKQPSVKIVEKDITYVFICLNETEVTDSETGTISYEYDYNEFSEALSELQISDITEYPEKYLFYVPKKESVSEPSDMKAYIDKQIEELRLSIANTNAQLLGGN